MCKTIKQKVKFAAPPLIVYSLLANAKTHRAITGRSVTMPAKVGARFSFYGGIMSGISVDLVPGKRMVLAWRDRQFPEGIFSMATFSLVSTQDGGTELTLTHRGVPKDLIPRISSEWRELYWVKMKQFLSLKQT
jgi:uncharacterized protein YndB with AHSA1/START domain